MLFQTAHSAEAAWARMQRTESCAAYDLETSTFAEVRKAVLDAVDHHNNDKSLRDRTEIGATASSGQQST